MSDLLEGLLVLARPQVAVWYDQKIAATPSRQSIEDFLNQALSYARAAVSEYRPAVFVPSVANGQAPERLAKGNAAGLAMVERANTFKFNIAIVSAVAPLRRIGIKEELAARIVALLHSG